MYAFIKLIISYEYVTDHMHMLRKVEYFNLKELKLIDYERENITEVPLYARHPLECDSMAKDK